MQVTTHVHQIPVATPTLFPATKTNVYFVVEGNNAVLIDAGYRHEAASRAVVEYWKSIGSPKVTALLLTHFHKDHSPGAEALSQTFGCSIYAHPLELPDLEKEIAPAQVNGTVEEGDVIEIGSLRLHVLHAPGHTHGCLNFWLPEDGVLFTADNIVAEGTTWIGPPEGDLTRYLETLKRLKTYDAAWIAPGHGGMIRDVQEKIDFFIGRRLEREQQIFNLIRETPRTADELLHAVYHGIVHPSVVWVAERTILGHVNKLLADGRIEARQDGNGTRYHALAD